MFKASTAVLVSALILSCAGKQSLSEKSEILRDTRKASRTFDSPMGKTGEREGASTFGEGVSGDVPAVLEELAELERSGPFVPGMGLTESNLREKAGDYAGAVLAVFKELFWAYSLGNGGVTREAIADGLGKLLTEEGAALFGPEAREQTAGAVRAILAFFEGRWKEAEAPLREIYGGTGDDSYSRWMILVCGMEQGEFRIESRSAYGSIRARYESFPGYWYYAARAACGLWNSPAAAASYAERCINLAPEGPYAAECRGILAEALGLKAADAFAIRTRREIESIIALALNLKNPGVLSDLLPLAALPDNPSTLYAAGAMRSLASEGSFRDWYVKEAARAGGRLAERLLFISRG
ncbi:MAG: hypothetical protein LBD31_04880 [Treponema sp.]|jgi:hypothetical protein|nr:hypothetical protein [Treponema sp.]